MESWSSALAYIEEEIKPKTKNKAKILLVRIRHTREKNFD